MMNSLQRLHQFVAVAEELHFGRAAKRLNITQPPLSMQIRNLETDIGATLLRRTKRHVELTEAGRVLLQESHRLLDQFDNAITLTQRAARGEIGSLRIGFVSTADYGLLPPLIRKFRRRFPDVELTLQELTTDAQMKALAEGNLDIGFLLSPIEHTGIEHEIVYQEPLIAALPSNHKLAKLKPAVPAQRLSSEDFIMFPRAAAPTNYDKVIAFTEAVGFSPKISQTAVQMQTIVSLVSAGLGVALVPACIRNLKRSGVVYRNLKPAPPLFQTAVAWPTGKLSIIGEAFCDLIETTTRFRHKENTDESPK